MEQHPTEQINTETPKPVSKETSTTTGDLSILDHDVPIHTLNEGVQVTSIIDPADSEPRSNNISIESAWIDDKKLQAIQDFFDTADVYCNGTPWISSDGEDHFGRLDISCLGINQALTDNKLTIEYNEKFQGYTIRDKDGTSLEEYVDKKVANSRDLYPDPSDNYPDY
jgi:hypothetical protein